MNVLAKVKNGATKLYVGANRFSTLFTVVVTGNVIRNLGVFHNDRGLVAYGDHLLNMDTIRRCDELCQGARLPLSVDACLANVEIGTQLQNILLEGTLVPYND